MALLLLFALIAGGATALTPCVLPVLPALLSAGATGGRRRPLGIVIGLVVCHTIAIVALASVIDGVGLADGAVRTVAVVVLAVFGVALIWPRLGDAIEGRLSRLARFGPKNSGHGFWSGLAVGGALGFVYAPCAGPILAAVVAAGATARTTGQTVAVAIAYGVGSGIVLFILATGGRALVERIKALGRGPRLQQAMGAILVITAIAMATQVDVRFQTALADHFPSFVTNPTGGLERSAAAQDRLAKLGDKSKFDRATASAAGVTDSAGKRSPYPNLGAAPGFQGGGKWLDTPGDKPLALKGLRGRVVLVDFWTYTCINCIRTLPQNRALDAEYRSKGLTVVGVHTPEFPFERTTSNVRKAIAQNKLRYPVVQDNDYKIWNAYGNQYWPAQYLIDSRGRVRYTNFGEGNEGKTESAIRSLLAETRGGESLGRRVGDRAIAPGSGQQTPETYLGSKRAMGWVPGPPTDGMHDYPGDTKPELNAFALSGRWKVDGERAAAVRGAAIDARFRSQRVYLVMRSAGGKPRTVQVKVDGKPQPPVTVTGDRLYTLVSLPRAGTHTLHLDFAPGVSGYAFTFG